MGHVRQIVLLVAVGLLALLPIAYFARPGAAGAPWMGAQFFPGSKPVDMGKPHPTAPIQVAGTKDSLWVLLPSQTSDGKTDCFRLWAHAAGAKADGVDVWEAVKGAGGVLLAGLPSQMALQVPPFGEQIPSSAVVFYDDGPVKGFSPNDDHELPYLPQGQKPVAVVGGSDGKRVLWAMTRGAGLPATQPATQAPTPATTQAAEEPSSASAPVASATQPAPVWNFYLQAGMQWAAKSSLRPGGDNPTLAARVALALEQDQLWLVWYEPAQPDMLKVKFLKFHDESVGAWSSTIQRVLPEAITRLQVVTLPQMVVLWPAKAQANENVSLHGVTLSPEGNVDENPKGVRVLKMDLGESSRGVNIDRDIAVGLISNSIAVMVQGTDGVLRQSLFSSSGASNGAPVRVDPALTAAKSSPYLGNAPLAILIVLMVLSMWYWRSQPALLALPKGVQVAALGQRMAAGLIDLSLPLVIVVLGFGLYDTDKFANAWPRIMKAYTLEAPDQARELLWFLAIYLVHVTIGEMASGKSLGKAVFGLKVIGINGKKARPWAVLVRNVVRIAELLVPPVLMVAILTPLRQRVGDIVARTVVVQLHSLPNEDDEGK